MLNEAAEAINRGRRQRADMKPKQIAIDAALVSLIRLSWRVLEWETSRIEDVNGKMEINSPVVGLDSLVWGERTECSQVRSSDASIGWRATTVTAYLHSCEQRTAAADGGALHVGRRFLLFISFAFSDAFSFSSFFLARVHHRRGTQTHTHVRNWGKNNQCNDVVSLTRQLID